MKHFAWNPEKNDTLKRERGVSFEAVVFHIARGDVLAILEHPNHNRYPGQRIFIIDINGYAHLVPFVEDDEDDNEGFLKTIIPSRKATNTYLKGRE